MKSKERIEAELKDLEATLRGLNEDKSKPLWERRRWRLWHYCSWDVKSKSPKKSHIPTAVKVLRWVLEEEPW